MKRADGHFSKSPKDQFFLWSFSGEEKSYLEGKVEENRGTVDFLLANLGQKFSSTKK